MAYEMPSHKYGRHTYDNNQVPIYNASAPHYPLLRGPFGNVNEEGILEGWTSRGQNIVNEPPASFHGKNRIYKGDKEDVDAEANLFIKQEHSKFEERKWVRLDS